MKTMRPSKGLMVFMFLLLMTSCRSLDPSFNFGAYSAAERFYDKGAYEKAIAKYEEYIRENPEGNMAVISQYYMAKSYEGLSEPDKARELYEKIIKEHPDLVWANFSKERIQELKDHKIGAPVPLSNPSI